MKQYKGDSDPCHQNKIYEEIKIPLKQEDLGIDDDAGY